MSGLPPAWLKKTQEALSSAFLQPSTDKTQLFQPTQPRRALRRWVWAVVVIGGIVVGGRLLFFEVERNPWQLPLKAKDWTGFGESYDNNVSEVREEGTETDGKATKRIDKTTTTQKRLQPAKTLWDWASLLLAPATLAALGFLFQSSQEKAKQAQEKTDKERNADQQRETALQDYLDYLSALLVDKQLKQFLPPPPTPNEAPTTANAESSDVTEVSKAKPEGKIDADAALDVVKAKTLALFRLFDQADPTDMPRKASVLAFLGDSGLLVPLDLDLRRSHWAKANLRRAQLSGADLTGADLTGADLNGANLSIADLRGADLRGADLRGANLSHAVLRIANLSHAVLRSADLRGADLRGANLSIADLESANLESADLRGANLTCADLRGANLTCANLGGANLTCANLGGANLKSANLESADLIGADLESANLESANLTGAYLLDADLSRADLTGADLSSADLSSANLTGADLTGANLESADLRGADLTGANLLGADLSRAYLRSANLSSAILLGVALSTAKGLTQTQLEGNSPPLLCHVTLPEGVNVNPQRDCAKLPAVLLDRYPEAFKDLEDAKAYVDKTVPPK